MTKFLIARKEVRMVAKEQRFRENEYHSKKNEDVRISPERQALTRFDGDQEHQASSATIQEPEPSDISGGGMKAEDSQPELAAMFSSVQTTERKPDADSAANLPAAPVVELEQTPPAAAASRDKMARQSQHIGHLMAAADMQIMMKKLTLPEGDNALESYRKVLELQPQHQEALDGIENIGSIYKNWAYTAQQRGEWENAELYLSRALITTPDDAALNAELRRIREEKTAFLQREAEAARVASIEAEPAPEAAHALLVALPELVSIKNVKHEILTPSNPARALIQATVSGKTSRVEVSAEINKQVTSYPMNESGSSGEEPRPNDLIYTREIPLRYPAESTRYVVAAYKQDGTVIYSPQGGTQTYIIEPLYQGPAVVINEFMASNNQTIADPQGDYDDWIEIYNRTPNTVDLSGYYLSDDKGNAKKWEFPQGTTIGGHGYLLVWADGESNYTRVGQSGFDLHTNFELSRAGEYVLLADSDENDNKILDGASFERQPSDFSISRHPDGVGDFSVTSVPTPGRKN